jgi:hypothetical protein
MEIDTIGEMHDFGQVAEGRLFYCDLNGDPTIAMRFTFVQGTHAVPAVISFSHAAHSSMPPPFVLEAAQFANRSVLVFKNAAFRTPSDLSKWKRGSTPRLDASGSVMLGTGNCVFLRAYKGSGGLSCLDVDIVSGVAEPARSRPEQFWTDEWSLVRDIGSQKEAVLLHSANGS